MTTTITQIDFDDDEEVTPGLVRPVGFPHALQKTHEDSSDPPQPEHVIAVNAAPPVRR